MSSSYFPCGVWPISFLLCPRDRPNLTQRSSSDLSKIEIHGTGGASFELPGPCATTCLTIPPLDYLAVELVEPSNFLYQQGNPMVKLWVLPSQEEGLGDSLVEPEVFLCREDGRGKHVNCIEVGELCRRSESHDDEDFVMEPGDRFRRV